MSKGKRRGSTPAKRADALERRARRGREAAERARQVAEREARERAESLERRARCAREAAEREREEAEREARERRQRVIAGASLLALAALLVLGVAAGPQLPGPDAAGASLVVVLAIGLTAGGLSCLAVQGGLLTVAVTGERALPGAQPRTLAHNAAPIGWFLAAKFVAYTALGGALGALGQLAQPSVQLRVGMQIATALLMIATALHFLGVHPIFRYAILTPPRALTRRISATARGGGAFAPALLGALTVFLPCGVTQAMQLVAINSGDPLTGAAILATFVIGTSPLFFSLGYFATTLSAVAHARFLRFAAIAILAVALVSLDAALRLGGSPITSAAVKSALFAPPTPVPAEQAGDGTQEAVITAGSGGYSPRLVQLRAGRPARLIFTGDGSAGCSLALIFADRQYILSADAPTAIQLPAMRAGERIDYTCTMGMYGGSVEAIA